MKTISGRNPMNTVYLTNMPPNQPNHIYVRQIKELLKADGNVQIGFDGQSNKIFVEYKNVAEVESVVADGRQVLTTIGETNISINVYEAVRKRQLREEFILKVFR